MTAGDVLDILTRAQVDPTYYSLTGASQEGLCRRAGVEGLPQRAWFQARGARLPGRGRSLRLLPQVHLRTLAARGAQTRR